MLEGREIEVGRRLGRGTGSATAVVRARLEHGQEGPGPTRIVAGVRPDNARSLRVVERLGLRPDGEVHVSGVRCLRFRTPPS